MKKGNYLSGPEPVETEKLTEAQKNDLRRPGFMSSSNKSASFSEDDDTPAIELKTGNENAEIITPDSKPKFKIDASFEKEIKERQAKEKRARLERQKNEEQKKKQEASEKQQEIEQKLKEAQTLNPEDIKEELGEENYQKNLSKLYPDAKPVTSEIENAIWNNRKDKGAEIAGRAKLESIENSNFTNAITASVVLQAISTPITIVTLLSDWQNPLFFLTILVAYALQIINVIILFNGAESFEHHNISGDYASKLRYASIIPGTFLRFIFIFIASKIPITGSIIGTIVGVTIGAAIHYSFLNRYNIYVSIKDTLINTAAGALPLLIYFLYGEDQISASFGIIYFIVAILEYVLGDRFAMLMAYRTNK